MGEYNQHIRNPFLEEEHQGGRESPLGLKINTRISLFEPHLSMEDNTGIKEVKPKNSQAKTWSIMHANNHSLHQLPTLLTTPTNTPMCMQNSHHCPSNIPKVTGFKATLHMEIASRKKLPSPGRATNPKIPLTPPPSSSWAQPTNTPSGGENDVRENDVRINKHI